VWPVLGVAALTDLEQLVFDFDLSGAEPPAPGPAIKRNVGAGPAKLLRRLISTGLDPDALEHAAQLCAHLDEEPAA
jgi:hypothetical protein